MLVRLLYLGDVFLPLSRKALGYAVGEFALDTWLSGVWCEVGLDAL